MNTDTDRIEWLASKYVTIEMADWCSHSWSPGSKPDDVRRLIDKEMENDRAGFYKEAENS